jgi:hypothetical protein
MSKTRTSSSPRRQTDDQPWKPRAAGRQRDQLPGHKERDEVARHKDDDGHVRAHRMSAGDRFATQQKKCVNARVRLYSMIGE